MSPHIEDWTTPLQAEDFSKYPLVGDWAAGGEMPAGGSGRMFVLNIGCGEDDADFIPESFE